MCFKKSLKIYQIKFIIYVSILLNNIAYPNNLSIKKGEKIYRERCASCHGKNAEGKNNGFFLSPNLTVYSKGYEKFLDILTNGYGRMPAWGGRSVLKKNQIEELSLYLKYIATDKTNWN